MLSGTEILRLLADQHEIRFVVDIQRSQQQPPEPVAFSLQTGDWLIRGSFKAYGEKEVGIATAAHCNSLTVYARWSGKSVIVGPGAGPGITAAAMFGDARKLLGMI